MSQPGGFYAPPQDGSADLFGATNFADIDMISGSSVDGFDSTDASARVLDGFLWPHALQASPFSKLTDSQSIRSNYEEFRSVSSIPSGKRIPFALSLFLIVVVD